MSPISKSPFLRKLSIHSGKTVGNIESDGTIEGTVEGDIDLEGGTDGPADGTTEIDGDGDGASEGEIDVVGASVVCRTILTASTKKLTPTAGPSKYKVASRTSYPGENVYSFVK